MTRETRLTRMTRITVKYDAESRKKNGFDWQNVRHIQQPNHQYASMNGFCTRQVVPRVLAEYINLLQSTTTHQWLCPKAQLPYQLYNNATT